jgi:hypothetical protein
MVPVENRRRGKNEVNKERSVILISELLQVFLHSDRLGVYYKTFNGLGFAHLFPLVYKLVKASKAFSSSSGAEG